MHGISIKGGVLVVKFSLGFLLARNSERDFQAGLIDSNFEF